MGRLSGRVGPDLDLDERDEYAVSEVVADGEDEEENVKDCVVSARTDDGSGGRRDVRHFRDRCL